MNEYSKQKYLFTVEITKLSVFIKINLYKKNPIFQNHILQLVILLKKNKHFFNVITMSKFILAFNLDD